MRKYHIAIPTNVVGGMFLMMESYTVEAKDSAEAITEARRQHDEKGRKYYRRGAGIKAERYHTYEITFRNRRDRRQRETWIVNTHMGEKTAIRNASQKAYRKANFVPEANPCKVVVK